MQRLRLILGAVLATAFVAGSAVIVYTDRPVMRLRGSVNAPNAGAQGVPREREGGGEDLGENEGGEGGAVQPALPANPGAAPAPAQAPPPSGGTPSTGTYTMADVGAHASANDCWSVINGSVYDLTDWINRHPGGPDVIIMLCGVDGSAAYNGQHGGQQRPQYYLSLLKIGALR